MADLSALIERCEALAGPSREVDADVYIAFNIPAERVGRIDRLGGCVGWWPNDAPYESAIDVPAYTASIDAAIALVERVLPGWSWEARKSGFGIGQASVWDPMCAPAVRPTGRVDHSSSPAIALVLATLRALQAQGGE